MQLRTITINDYLKLIKFWKENYFVSDMDSAEYFSIFLDKNPSLSILIEEDGEIIGSALGSYDGRRGYLQKVVTRESLRGRGIGKQMVDEIVKRLKRVGAVYIPISVEKNNIAFYEKCGFVRKTSTSMSRDL